LKSVVTNMKLFCLSPLLLAAVSANQYDPTNVRKKGANQRALKGSSGSKGSGSRSKSGSKGKCKDFTGAYDVIESASSVVSSDATDVAKIAFTCFDNEEDWDNFEDIVFWGVGRRNLGEKKEEERMLNGHPYPHFDDLEGIEQLCYFEAIGFTGGSSQGIHNYGYAAITTVEKAEEHFFGDDDDDDDLDDELVPYSQNCAFTTFATEYFVSGFMVKDNVLSVFTENPFPYFAHKTTK